MSIINIKNFDMKHHSFLGRMDTTFEHFYKNNGKKIKSVEASDNAVATVANTATNVVITKEATQQKSIKNKENLPSKNVPKTTTMQSSDKKTLSKLLPKSEQITALQKDLHTARSTLDNLASNTLPNIAKNAAKHSTRAISMAVAHTAHVAAHAALGGVVTPLLPVTLPAAHIAGFLMGRIFEKAVQFAAKTGTQFAVDAANAIAEKTINAMASLAKNILLPGLNKIAEMGDKVIEHSSSSNKEPTIDKDAIEDKFGFNHL
jgi:hypothetical protein